MRLRDNVRRGIKSTGITITLRKEMRKCYNERVKTERDAKRSKEQK